MRITGVIISTELSRFAAMRDFYVDVLGLRPRSQRPEFVNFELQDTRLTITTHSQVTGANRTPGRLLVNMAVEDIEAEFRRLSAAGARFVRTPESEKWGGTVATLEDPDGNYLQLFQLPEE